MTGARPAAFAGDCAAAKEGKNRQYQRDRSDHVEPGGVGIGVEESLGVRPEAQRTKGANSDHGHVVVFQATAKCNWHGFTKNAQHGDGEGEDLWLVKDPIDLLIEVLATEALGGFAPGVDPHDHQIREENRQREKPNAGGDQHGPSEQRHVVERHALASLGEDRGDDHERGN